jgi:type IV pilus assembly protein PilY1
MAISNWSQLFKVLLVSLFLWQEVVAEDIDLFVSAPAGNTEAPNVLIILDNTANWNTPFVNEKAALVSLIDSLPEDTFNVGVMMFTETGGGNSGNNGAYVRAAVRFLNTDAKGKYSDLVNSFGKNADKSNGGKAGLAMEEAYRYFKGVAPYAGNGKSKTDYTGNSSGTSEDNAVYALADAGGDPNNALTAKAGAIYNSPIAAGSCAKNFVIYISNGAAQDNNSDITTSTAALAGFGGDTTTIPLSPSGSQKYLPDEWARFMKEDLEIITYAIDIDKVTTGQGPGWTALLESMADQGDGKYFDVDSGDASNIVEALEDIFSEIQSVNSVFASVSLPVSVNTQGTFLNQVFVGKFRPDGSALPRWHGNLKQYHLGFVSGDLKLIDADSDQAINTATGFIAECARSFWTPSGQDTYWNFDADGSCIISGNSTASSNYPDGNVVYKGAQGYELREENPATRTVYTCNSTSCTTLTNFSDANTTDVTEALLGAADATERTQLINWMRGSNLDDEGGKGTTVMRPSAHGDVVHSRPVAINVGTDLSPNVVVVYGANDGMLRAINGNQTAASGSVDAGNEYWTFMPPEFFEDIKRIRDNDVKISFPGIVVGAGDPTPAVKRYGMDGTVTAYSDSGAGDHWIFATMRRGGRSVYAFDISDPTSPDLKWRIGCPNLDNDVGCTAGMTEIGQTWSAAKVIQSSGFDSGDSPMLLVGGGYDNCEDFDDGTVNHNCVAGDKGDIIYILDADDGSILNSFSTDRGVIGDFTVVIDSNGLALYAYGADMGGNIYRIDIGAVAPAGWSMTKVADLGCSGVASCSANRKFMFAPDVVDNGGGVFSLLLGSGDREKPLSSYTAAESVTNYFFMLEDNPTDPTWLSSENATCGADVICLDSLFSIAANATSPSAADLAGSKGWSLGLASTEQIVTSAITIFGTTTFSTHQPATGGSCDSLGAANVYNIGFKDAAPTSNDGERYGDLAGGGLPPSPTAGLVIIDGIPTPFCIGCDTDSALEGSSPSSSLGGGEPKTRVFWNEEQQ